MAPLLKTSIPDCVWPAVPSPSAAALLAQLFQLEQTQWLPRQALSEAQLTQLRHLTTHARAHSPFYRRLFDEHGIDADEHWSEEKLRTVPLLTRQMLLDQGANINSRVVPSAHGSTHTAQTSGSTGQMVKLKRTGLNGSMWMALTLRDHFWHQRDFAQRTAFIRPLAQPQDDDAIAKREGWGPPATLLFETGPSYRQSTSLSITEQAAWLLRCNPYYLLTLPTNLNALLDEFARIGRLPTCLREVRCTNETFTQRLKARCEDEFALKAVDIYSAAEVGIIALQCPVSGLYHVQAESLIVEILDDGGEPCKEGAIGRVVITDLHNFATPLIRYEIRDYAEVGSVCACGRGLPTFKRILGRRRNMVTLPDGSRHWPTMGYLSFLDIAPIRQFQAIQRSVDAIEMNLVVATPLSAEQEARLRKVIQEALGYPFNLLFRYRHTELPKTRGGKFEDFISMI
jgi:phenylacetate-CoA ligase